MNNYFKPYTFSLSMKEDIYNKWEIINTKLDGQAIIINKWIEHDIDQHYFIIRCYPIKIHSNKFLSLLSHCILRLKVFLKIIK